MTRSDSPHALAAAAAGSASPPANAAPVNYKLPEETAAFKPGPGLDVVQNNCTACHSADYIKTQPRGPKFKKDFWQAEVTKMIKVYGAPIDDADVAQDRRLSRRDLLRSSRERARVGVRQGRRRRRRHRARFRGSIQIRNNHGSFAIVCRVK